MLRRAIPAQTARGTQHCKTRIAKLLLMLSLLWTNRVQRHSWDRMWNRFIAAQYQYEKRLSCTWGASSLPGPVKCCEHALPVEMDMTWINQEKFTKANSMSLPSRDLEQHPEQLASPNIDMLYLEPSQLPMVEAAPQPRARHPLPLHLDRASNLFLNICAR